MPAGRRTRAMGYSPGGPKALDLNAPTRQPRKGKTTTDAPEPPTRTTRSRAGAKRNIEELAEDQPPAKKTRRTRPAVNSETVTSTSQALTVLPDSGSDDLPESTSVPQEYEPVVEPEQAFEPRVNAQQPTPPLDTPVNATPPHNTLNADEPNTQSQKKERRISDMISRYLSRRPDENKEEKALSECDDDEWEERYSAVMEQARNPTPFISKSNPSWEKIAPSSATRIDWEPQKKSLAAENQSGHCMTPSSSTTNPFTIASLLAALGARPITRIDTIVAISASLDWYEHNPATVAPTAVEMRAMLDNFARAKQAPKTLKSNSTAKYLQSPTPNTPLTPKALVISDKLRDPQDSAESDDDPSYIDDQEELGMEEHGDLNTDIQLSRSESSDQHTVAENHQPSTPRSWASALSASAIGNVLLTPVNWFTKRNRDRQNISATEPRPVRVKPDLRRLSNSHQKSHTLHTSTQATNRFLRKGASSNNLKASPFPLSPTPTAPQPRRGRPDSHLPVHLRGVRFEDLPSEWQDVSQHLRKPTADQIEDQEKENDEPVDMEKLLAIARRTREERAAKEREEKERKQKELKEQADRVALRQDDTGSNEKPSADHVNRVGKKRVTFSPKKTYSAKLGHSTYGMPLNIDDSSSEEEEEEVEFSEPRTHFGRNSRPVKSCLKRPYQQPTYEERHEVQEDGEDGYDPHRTKRVRLAGFTPSETTEVPIAQTGSIGNSRVGESFLYVDDPHRARPPSNFISKPPSETRMAEAAQREYERLNPPGTLRSSGFPQTARTSLSPNKSSGNLNVFTSGGRVHIEIAPLNSTFQNPVTPEKGSPIEKDGVSEDETSHPVPSTGPLIETRNARLNKQREDVLKHKPKVSSTLQITQISSPPHDITSQKKDPLAQNGDNISQDKEQSSPTHAETLENQKQLTSAYEEPSEIQEQPTQVYEEIRLEDVIFDAEVLKSIASLDDEDIVAEVFNFETNHVEPNIEASVMSAAAKAFDSSS